MLHAAGEDQMLTTRRYAQSMARLFPDGTPEKMTVAVSGGGDSIALLRAAAGYAERFGYVIEACTVDHRLRRGSVEEAAWVGDICRRIGVPHETLVWREGPSQGGNIQEDARLARISLIGDFARRSGSEAVLLGHNEDDVAENYLMRGTGMAPLRVRDGLLWARPLLSCSRDQIREELDRAGVTYVNDPSNENDAFRRVRVRKQIAADPAARRDALSGAAAAMRLRREAKEEAAAIIGAHVEVRREGFAEVSLPGLASGAGLREALRVLICAFGDPDPRFRPGRLETATERVFTGEKFTLGGCVFSSSGAGRVVISREPSRVTPLAVRRGGTVMLDGRTLVRDIPEDGDLMLRGCQDGVSRPCLLRPDGCMMRLEGALSFGKEELLGDRFFNEPESVSIPRQDVSPSFHT